MIRANLFAAGAYSHNPGAIYRSRHRLLRAPETSCSPFEQPAQLLRPPSPAAPRLALEFPAGTAGPPNVAEIPRPTSLAVTPYDGPRAKAAAAGRPTASRSGHTAARTAAARPTTPPPYSPTGTSGRRPDSLASNATAAGPLPPLP